MWWHLVLCLFLAPSCASRLNLEPLAGKSIRFRLDVQDSQEQMQRAVLCAAPKGTHTCSGPSTFRCTLEVDAARKTALVAPVEGMAPEQYAYNVEVILSDGEECLTPVDFSAPVALVKEATSKEVTVEMQSDRPWYYYTVVFIGAFSIAAVLLAGVGLVWFRERKVSRGQSFFDIHRGKKQESLAVELGLHRSE